MVLIVVLYALLAGTFSLGKMILAYTQPIFVVGMRMSIAGALLILYHFIINRTTLRIQKNHIGLFIQATFFTIYIPYLLRYWGLVYLSSSKACLLYNFGPFVTYFFSYLLCSEKVTVKKIAGLIIGFLGLLPLVINSSWDSNNNHGLFILPELALLTAVSSMSYGWLIIHRLINKNNYPPSMTNGVIMFAGGILALITSLLFEDANLYITDFVPFTTILVTIIIVSNLICHNLYGALLRIYTPTMLSFTSFLSPLFAAFYGWLFMHETISLCFYLSALVIFIGLWLFYSDELKQNSLAKIKISNTGQTA
jgi:drug/metabolite transporter (DMT)-like permease